MEIFNNTTRVVKDDLEKNLQQGSRVSIAAACFSIYAYQELKVQLESCKELRFIFTSPTFVAEKTPKERREFYIPRLKREKSLYGTEFEVRLRNELKQKAVARKCADWMRRKVRFKSNTTHEGMNNFLLVEGSDDSYTYLPMNTFTTVDLGCERGNNLTNMVTRFENPASIDFLQTFNAIWNDKDKLSDVSTPVRFCSFSPKGECRKMAVKGVQPLNNYTCRFRPSSLKYTDKSGLDGLQAGK